MSRHSIAFERTFCLLTAHAILMGDGLKAMKTSPELITDRTIYDARWISASTTFREKTEFFGRSLQGVRYLTELADGFNRVCRLVNRCRVFVGVYD